LWINFQTWSKKGNISTSTGSLCSSCHTKTVNFKLIICHTWQQLSLEDELLY
jgi:hypothetical protein